MGLSNGWSIDNGLRFLECEIQSWCIVACVCFSTKWQHSWFLRKPLRGVTTFSFTSLSFFFFFLIFPFLWAKITSVSAVHTISALAKLWQHCWDVYSCSQVTVTHLSTHACRKPLTSEVQPREKHLFQELSYTDTHVTWSLCRRVSL